MNTSPITLLEVLRIINDADSLFRRAAKAWERGNNSGDSAYMTRMEKQTDSCRARAEDKLAPFGITCDYPGLYPSFEVRGHSYNTTESAVSAAVSITLLRPIAKAGTVVKVPSPNYCEDDMDCRYVPDRDELRVLPIGSMGNLILCLDGYVKHRNAEYDKSNDDGDQVPTWDSLKVYDPS
jgi:hypothetical protein